MAWGSTAPAAIKAIVAALQPVDATVTDTVIVSGSSTREVVCIAYQSDDQAAIEDAQVDSEIGTVSADRERYTINNVVYVAKGRDIVAARERAFDLLSKVGQAVRADSTLAGTVMRAWIGSWSFLPQQTTSGAYVTVAFGIEIDAYTT